jgi:hypothetical protein
MSHRLPVPEREEEYDYQKFLLIGEEMVELQATTGGYFFSCEWVSKFCGTSILLQKAFGHHHNKREKIVHMQESTGKRRGT